MDEQIKVKIKYLGRPGVQDHYISGTVNVHVNDIIIVPIQKAGQLSKDFPDQWEILDKEVTPEKAVAYYEDRIIAAAKSNKDIIVTYPDNSIKRFPAGSEIGVIGKKKSKPKKKAKVVKKGKETKTTKKTTTPKPKTETNDKKVTPAPKPK